MRPNPLYQATVEALEAVLPPRVVSRALKEGLGEVDGTPSTVTLEEIERILKGAVFKYLQTTNPVERARATVATVLEQLQAEDAAAADAAAVADAPASTEAAGAAPAPHGAAPEPSSGDGGDDAPSSEALARLGALRSAMRPFNLYFDWPEVRKLRAQAQVLEGEVGTLGDVEPAFEEAEAQLRIVEQKLEDQLVLQARDLGELEEAFEAVASLGGPRVRRLEALVGQVRQAQAGRTLADAECERGRKLARELRKLMESNVFRPEDPPDPSIEGRRRRRDLETHPEAGRAEETDDALEHLTDEIVPEHLSPEVTERLLRLDLEAEAKDLAALLVEHAELLRYLPALEEQFAALSGGLDGRASVAGDIESLRVTLAETAAGQRTHLEHELEAVARDIVTLHADVDVTTLERSLRVTRDVLAEGLPAYADVHAIRDLHRSARERSEELIRREAEGRSRTEAQVKAQAEVLERIEAALARPGYDGDTFAHLRGELESARAALVAAVEEGRGDAEALERGRRGESRWERAVAEQADDARERVRARLRAYDARLSALPELGSVLARATDLRQEVARLADDDDLEERQVTALGSLVERLHADAVAEAAHRLDSLGKEAGESVGEVVLRELQAAARSLDAGSFPDLPRLRLVIDQERASTRERDQSRLQRLQLEATRLDAADVPSVERLRTALATARAELDDGRAATRHLDAAETAVVEIERQIRERLDAFEGRLDAALAAFATVERLNNDDVAAVRRSLTHLDSQRDAIGRVSPGLQAQLISSLRESETLLLGLDEAYEATRAVADQLVSGSMLDDVLGFFDDMAGAFGDERDDEAQGVATPLAAPEPEAPVDAETLALVDRYRALDGVEAVLAVDEHGRVLAGSSDGLPDADVAAALVAARDAWRRLGDVWEGGGTDLVDVGLGHHHLLVADVGRAMHLLLVVSDPDVVPALTTRVRDERAAPTAVDAER